MQLSAEASPSNVIGFPEPTARAIAQEMLRATGECLTSCDAERFVSLFRLPQEMETLTGRRTISTPEELCDLLHAVNKHLETEGVTFLDRHCLASEFVGPDLIVTTHQTSHWVGSKRVTGPFNCFGLIERTDGRWQITYARYAITDNPRHDAILLGLISE